MKKSVLITTVFVAFLLTAGSAFSWSGNQGRGNCRNLYNYKGQAMTLEQHRQQVDSRLERMAVILDLTDTQKQQIKKLMNEKWENRQSMRAQIQATRTELREYRQGAEFNETEFRAKVQKQSILRTEMMVQQANVRQQLFAILTPEQQQKAESFTGMYGGPRNCNGYGYYGGQGFGPRYNN